MSTDSICDDIGEGDMTVPLDPNATALTAGV